MIKIIADHYVIGPHHIDQIFENLEKGRTDVLGFRWLLEHWLSQRRLTSLLEAAMCMLKRMSIVSELDIRSSSLQARERRRSRGSDQRSDGASCEDLRVGSYNLAFRRRDRGICVDGAIN
jgi:hypothetical protein